MLLIKPKYKKKKKRVPIQPYKKKKRVPIQTVEPTTDYDGAPKPKKQKIDSLINGKGIIYE